MAEFFASGRAVDMVIALLVVETAVLSAYAIRRARRGATSQLLAAAAAGIGLLLALRAALQGASWIAVALPLAAAGAAHVIEVALRLRQRFDEVDLSSQK